MEWKVKKVNGKYKAIKLDELVSIKIKRFVHWYQWGKRQATEYFINIYYYIFYLFTEIYLNFSYKDFNSTLQLLNILKFNFNLSHILIIYFYFYKLLKFRKLVKTLY